MGNIVTFDTDDEKLRISIVSCEEIEALIKKIDLVKYRIKSEIITVHGFCIHFLCLSLFHVREVGKLNIFFSK